MKKLDLNQMEQVNGAMDCSTGLGISTGLYAGGMILAATGVGAGIGVVLIGAGSFFLSGYNCAN